MKSKPFSNMLLYAQETFSSFEELPFGEVDSLILSWLSYIRFPKCEAIVSSPDGLNIRDLFHAEEFSSLFYEVKFPEDSLQLLSAVVASPRFRNITLHFYQEELNPDENEQFAAVTFHILPDLYYIAFRGTDCTITGWKEDFQLSLPDPIASQKRSLYYIMHAAAKISGRLLVGGHSKGGNLAVYASANAPLSLQERIIAIYSHDGPGFSSEELKSEGFLSIRNRIHKTLPKSSLVGMIFEQESEYDIIESNAISVMQHNPFSWEIENGTFKRRDELTPDAKLIQRKINDWLSEIPEADRSVFIEKLFALLDDTNARSFDEFGANLKENIPIVLKSISDMTWEEQIFMLKTLGKLF